MPFRSRSNLKVVGFLMAAVVWLLPAAAWADDWAGKTVFAKRQDLPLQYVNNVVGKFSHEARVLRDLGDWIEVRHIEKNDGSYMGCVKKVDVVLATDAVTYFSDVVRREPGVAWGWMNRAYAWELKGEPGIALKDMDEAIRLEPAAWLYNYRGLLKHNLKDYTGAIKDCDEAIRLDPKIDVAYINRGMAKRNLKDYAGAIKDYDEAIRLDPKFAMAYNNRGWAKSYLKDYTGAIKDYDEAIRFDPKLALAYNNRGGAKGILKDYTGAIQDYDEAIRLDPKDANAYNTRGWAKHNQRNFAAATRDYQSVLELDSKHALARCNLAFLYATATDASVRNAEKALAEAETVLAAEPSNAYGLNAKACALAVAGKYTDAIAVQEQALKDADYAADDNIDGGKHAADRIAAWKQETLWLQP